MDSHQTLTKDDDFDEVSLPGVGDNEQPTILEVLNRGIVKTEEEKEKDKREGTETGTEPTIVQRKSVDQINTKISTSTLEDELIGCPASDQESDILVSSSSTSRPEAEWNEAQTQPQPRPQPQSKQRSQLTEDDDNVLDFESHLIETVNNYSVSEDSDPWGVDIKELPPVEGESASRTSKIAVDPTIGTIFEVEPAAPKVLKSVETNIVEPSKHSGLAQEAQIVQDSADGVKQPAVESETKFAQETDTTKPAETELQASTEQKESTEAADISNGNTKPAWVIVQEIQRESENNKKQTEVVHNEQSIEQTSTDLIENPSKQLPDINNEAPLEEAIQSKPVLLESIHSKLASVDDNANLTESTKPDHQSVSPKTQPETEYNNLISDTATTPEADEPASLTQEIDQKLSELATHLTDNKLKVDLNGNIPSSSAHNQQEQSENDTLDVNGLPLPTTDVEKEQRQKFIDSLPPVPIAESDSNKVAALAKREYYQSLRQYLINHSNKPVLPPETYRWEDLRRAKQRGGYPWTHLYKRPLGPDEEPEIVLLLRKSQELRFASESPKSLKKVRIDDQVSIKETERYIQELSDVEDNPATEDETDDHGDDHEDTRSECISYVSDSVLTVDKRASKLGKIRGILKKRSPKKEPDSKSLPDTSTASNTSLALKHKSDEDISERSSRPLKNSHNKANCFPIMKKLKSMADRQKKNFRNIKKISLKKDEKITLEEEQKIIKLKTSPKAERSEIPHFIEKQDSDDVLEIVELDESPSRKRKDNLEHEEQAAAAAAAAAAGSSVLIPDEIIEIPKPSEDNVSDRQQTPEPTVSEILEEELKSNPEFTAPPKKSARLRREHVYEDIETNDELISKEITDILQIDSVEALKESLASQDAATLKDVIEAKTETPLERMGSSEEEVERSHLAPISSIDSASSEEERKPPLQAVAEESEAASESETVESSKKEEEKLKPKLENNRRHVEHVPWNDIELKPALKKEASPSPSEKKVTFSHVEDEAEPHREDIELPEGVAATGPKRWSNIR